MDLFIYSFYDRVSKQSVCLNFYHDNEEAKREAFHILKSVPDHRRADIRLVRIGSFNTETLKVTGLDHYFVDLEVEF